MAFLVQVFVFVKGKLSLPGVMRHDKVTWHYRINYGVVSGQKISLLTKQILGKTVPNEPNSCGKNNMLILQDRSSSHKCAKVRIWPVSLTTLQFPRQRPIRPAIAQSCASNTNSAIFEVALRRTCSRSSNLMRTCISHFYESFNPLVKSS
jgi:hypothetical protein